MPPYVDREVRDQDKKYPGTTKRWAACVNSGRVEVLEPVTATDGDPRVRQHVADIRDADAGTAFSTRRDLGETLTVAHALVLRTEGREVAVSIDDSQGAELAAARGLRNIDTLHILHLAIGLSLITTKAQLRTIYRAWQGRSTLPPLAQTGLLDQL